MSFIDAFLELTADKPREIIRLLKLIKEVDQRSTETSKVLENDQKIFFARRSKHTAEAQVELKRKINENFNLMSTLSELKSEILNEITTLLTTYTLVPMNSIIKKGESEVKAHEQSNPQSLHIESNLSKSVVITKKKTNENKFVGKKTSRTKSEYSDSDFIPNNTTNNTEEEQVYCKCKSGAYGDMIGCDNKKCPIQWFHYGCVGIKEKPDNSQHWYCSPECKSQALMEERNNRKRKKKA